MFCTEGGPHVECDKVFCLAVFTPWGEDLSKGQVLKQASFSGWHISPCCCSKRKFPKFRLKHLGDYCPAHWPVDKLVEDLPPL